MECKRKVEAGGSEEKYLPSVSRGRARAGSRHILSEFWPLLLCTMGGPAQLRGFSKTIMEVGGLLGGSGERKRREREREAKEKETEENAPFTQGSVLPEAEPAHRERPG